MSSSENVVASGALYGGNYYDWKVRLVAKLRLHGLERYIFFDRSPDTGIVSDVKWTMASSNVAKLIRFEVNPGLFRNVPTCDQDDAYRLMHRLEELATRFRFLDLPVEMRNEVYKYLIDSKDPITIRPNARTQSQYPAITKTSVQLRKESLPIMYARVTFAFASTITKVAKAHPKPTFEHSSAITSWAKRQVASQLKFLRNVTITEKYPDYCNIPIAKTISLSYSKPKGFHATNEGKPFDHSSQTRFDKYIETTEAMRQMFSMEGEILVMALTMNSIFPDGNAFKTA